MTRGHALWLVATLSLPSLACAGKQDVAARAADGVRAALAEEAARAGKSPTVTSAAGALGTTVVTAAIPGAYPGSGVARVLIDSASTYGVHGEHDLADLARARRWHEHPPTAEALTTLVGDGQFEGMLMVDDAHAPVLTRTAAGLDLVLTRRTFPSQAREIVHVVLPSKGKATVTLTPVAATAGAATGGDPIADAEKALASGTGPERSAAVTHLASSKDPRSLPLLARATTLGNEQLTADAILAIGSSPAAAAALKQAWTKLPASDRTSLVKMAVEAYGASFGALLQ